MTSRFVRCFVWFAAGAMSGICGSHFILTHGGQVSVGVDWYYPIAGAFIIAMILIGYALAAFIDKVKKQ